MAYKTAEERTAGMECTWTSISSLNWNEEDFAKKERNRERSIEKSLGFAKKALIAIPLGNSELLTQKNERDE